MYLVRDKTTLEALAYHCVAYHSGITAMDVYAQFNAKTMEMAWTPGAAEPFPNYFRVAPNHQAVALTLAEAVAAGHLRLQPQEKLVADRIVQKSNRELLAEGLIKLRPQQKLVDDQITDKTLREQIAEGLIKLNEPFEYINDKDEIECYTIAELVQKKRIDTRAVADQCLLELGQQLEEAIAQEYSAGYETKLTKDYLIWISDGKPADDRREQKFLTMQQRINAIRLQNKALRGQIKAIRAALKA